jgi:DNA mismatch repair protein MutS2
LIEQETLELLEWPRLCEQLATFAATKLGAIASLRLKLPDTQAESVYLLTQTQEFYQIESGLDNRFSFGGIVDIGSSLERAGLGGILTGEELLAIATTLGGMRRLRRLIEETEGIPTLKELVSQVRTYPEIEQEIYHCIEEDGTVADRASPTLRDIRAQMKILRERIYRRLQEILQKHGASVQESVITQRGDRFVIPVKAGQKEQIPGVIHDTSSTGVTLYIEPYSIQEHGNKLRQQRRQEQIEEEKILRELTQKIAARQDDLEYLLAIATALDLARARARYSIWLDAYPPQFIPLHEKQTITLRNLRHPLLIWQHRHENGADVVPITVEIEPKIRVIAITGPNTGGKTVTLKTLGLAALMAKAGLFVVAREPVEIPWFEQVLADIGDEQSLEQSLSTFSGHIHRIIRIIKANSPNSLVLLDEVGAGTDPAEGSALATALLKYFADHAGLTMATTHYGELKTLKYQDERFENASVEFNDETLSPTYRLLWGIPGRSNALSIAQRLGLDSAIITAAKELVGGFSEDINRVIGELERERREQEQKAKEAQKLLDATEKFYKEVSQKALSLQEREKTLKRYQEEEVQKALTQAKSEIAQVIRELQQGDKTAQKAQKATALLDGITERELPKVEKPSSSYLPQVGEKISIPRLGQTAEVLSLSATDAVVRFGLMKMTVELQEIESLDGKKVEIITKPSPPPPQSPSVAKSPPPLIQTSQNTVDIRGSRVAESEADLEKAIALATNYGLLWIIHGKGTGKLRQGVHEFLERHPQVSRYELAPQKEGGTGVTIAYLT